MSTIAVKKVKLGDNADLSKNFLIEVPAVADGTLTIKRENGTTVLSVDATGKAVIPGVVGTVAQVGGVPTGQVVERGSNANGEYVRFADGTQICTFAAASQNITTASGSSFISSSTDTWTFPATFLNAPVVFGRADSASNRWMTFAVVDATSAAYRQAGTISSATAVQSILAAIGRWF